MQRDTFVFVRMCDSMTKTRFPRGGEKLNVYYFWLLFSTDIGIFPLQQTNDKYRQNDDEIEIFVEQMFVDDVFFLYFRLVRHETAILCNVCARVFLRMYYIDEINYV